MATITLYNKFLLTQMNGGQDTTGSSTADWDRIVFFLDDTIKVALVTSSYTPSYTGHAAFNSVSSYQVSGTNYTSRGKTVTGIAISESLGVTTIDGDDVTWAQSGSGFSNARYGILYKDTGTNATSTLIACIDFGSDKGNVLAGLTLAWNGSGILTYTKT